MTAPQHTNRLAQETSPYLLQHAHNPVDWYPWGEEALQLAKSEDKPILLSVGYSACHWCHVMERESFENEAIAEIMNRYYLCIKVDREERPDVDAIYMSAVQRMTGQGGWPMTVFLTPEGKPFYGGTYYPPVDMYGRPGFPRILEAVAEAWHNRRSDVEQQGEEMLADLNSTNDLTRNLPDTLVSPAILESAFGKLAQMFDQQYGGFGGAPKFPQPANLDFLLRFHSRSKRQEPLAMVEKTLQRMALGGMYDQLGGGFHRYSTDHTWLVPHFEKMLYDNAQLVQTYLRAYQATRKPFYRGVAEETLEYVMREMTSPEGGFYSAQDADSEGVEGKFFVWPQAEVQELLGEQNAAIFGAFYDVTQHGNWEETNILHIVKDAPQVAQEFGISVQETAEILDQSKEKLFQVREQRIKPGLDDKILTAWNGLMLAAFAEAAVVLERKDFREVAIQNAEFLLSHLRYQDANGNQRLLRTYRLGAAKLNAYLEDYAFLADGLLWLYEATFDPRYLEEAHSLINQMLTYFWDDQNSGFFATSSDHEALIQRPKDWDDNATPSGNSVALEVLLRFATLTGETSYRQNVAKVLRKIAPILEKHPYGFARILGVLDFYLSTPKEIAIIGNPNDPATQSLLQTLQSTYLPNKVVALTPTPLPETNSSPLLHLLHNRPLLDNKPTIYVCENFTCQLPVTTPEALAQQLK